MIKYKTPSGVFQIIDDFENGVVDTTKWITVDGTTTEADGILQTTDAGGTDAIVYLASPKLSSNYMIVMCVACDTINPELSVTDGITDVTIKNIVISNNLQHSIKIVAYLSGTDVIANIRGQCSVAALGASNDVYKYNETVDVSSLGKNKYLKFSGGTILGIFTAFKVPMDYDI